MSIAKQTLEELSQDPVTRRIARAREDERKLRLMENAVSRADGMAEVVLKQLGLRFGSLPEAIVARIRSARPEQLDAWAERVLTAETLDEVLAP